MGKSPSRRAEQDVDPATARLAEAIDNLIALVLQRQGEAFWHGVELTPPQRIALRIVVDHGPLRLLEVAHRLDSTASKASRTVASLRDLGLLETEPDPEDGRAIQIVATAAGRRVVAERHVRLVGAVADLFAHTDPAERERIADLLGQLEPLLEWHPRGT